MSDHPTQNDPAQASDPALAENSRPPGIARRALRATLVILLVLALVGPWVWSTSAILYSDLPGSYLRTALALLFGGAPAAFAFLPDRRRTLRAFLVSALLVMLWWLTIRPSNDRDWAPDQTVLPYAEYDGDRVTIRNVRNFAHSEGGDYTVRYDDRTFDLNELERVYFVVEPFGNWKGMAHTFLSFGFARDVYLAVSYEIRREQGEEFSPWKGLFKQFELIQVIGDERDLIRLRSKVRGNTVYVYPVRASRASARALFRDVLARANRLREHPEFYNTLTNTCTTNIVRHVNHLAPGKVPYSFDVMFPGFSDKLAYDLGLIDTDLPFEEARERFRINDRAGQFADSQDFSRRIRPAP